MANKVKHTFFRYCSRCQTKFQPNGKTGKYCEGCKEIIRKEAIEKRKGE